MSQEHAVNSLVTGAHYVRALSAADDDRLCRAAFLELALRYLSPAQYGARLRLRPRASTHASTPNMAGAYSPSTSTPTCAPTCASSCARDAAAPQIGVIECSYDGFLDSAARLLPPLWISSRRILRRSTWWPNRRRCSTASPRC
jgi:hypothetical protein